MHQAAEIGARGTRFAFGVLPSHWAGGIASFAILGLVYIVYVLWPRWPDAPTTLDAPSLPIVVADVVFQVPPAAIRQKMQRVPGTQDHIDLAYFWPTLVPAAIASKLETGAPPPPTDRVFVNIAAAPAAMTPAERLKSIYPRYLEMSQGEAPPGLTLVPFRSGSPYNGEDLIYDAAAPDRFIARCTRRTGPTPGTCLYERFVGSADITIRFTRDWLSNWHNLLTGLDQLIERLAPAQRTGPS
jgi:hypothetical protein